MRIDTDDDCLMWFDSPACSPIILGNGAMAVFSGAFARANTTLKSVDLCFENGPTIKVPCGLARDDLVIDAPRLVDSPLGRQLVRQGGFWYAHPLTDPGHYRFQLRATFADNYITHSPLRTLQATKTYGLTCGESARRTLERVRDAVTSNGADTVVCMATYRPRQDRFDRQIESLCAQSYTRWVCIVCDDGSDAASIDMIRQRCDGDERFIVVTHSDNLGFYRNFERALNYVPRQASFIALADQDDEWDRAKLDVLVSKLAPEAMTGQAPTLVYSDLRVVDRDGAVVSETYWDQRRNNFSDADVVLLANTVTGAATVLDTRLLSTALPFPEPVGDAFHDHWLACCALSHGQMRYVDRPLYSYYQYDDSVIGHCDFASSSWLNILSRAPNALAKTLVTLCRPAQLKRHLIRIRAVGLAIHHQECRRLELVTATLKLRVQQPTISARSAWRLFGDGAGSGFRLLAKHVSIRMRGETTNNAELRLGAGYLIDASDRFRLAYFPAERAVKRVDSKHADSTRHQTQRR